MAAALASLNGKCFAFCTGGVELPAVIGQVVGEILRETSDSAHDQVRLRQAIATFSAFQPQGISARPASNRLGG